MSDGSSLHINKVAVASCFSKKAPSLPKSVADLIHFYFFCPFLRFPGHFSVELPICRQTSQKLSNNIILKDKFNKSMAASMAASWRQMAADRRQKIPIKIICRQGLFNRIKGLKCGGNGGSEKNAHTPQLLVILRSSFPFNHLKKRLFVVCMRIGGLSW